MPNMPGQEVLQLMKAAPELRDIPVIVITADFSQEIVCLDAGASDFIQKPYPNPGVVQARVRRTIELSEDRQIIQSAERDPLTDLYNLEFFYSYGEQYDQHHKGISTDAIVIDINHFAMVNERFGRAYADDVLRKVGVCVQSFVHDDGGIVSGSGDVFQVYCPHREDYKAMLEGWYSTSTGVWVDSLLKRSTSSSPERPCSTSCSSRSAQRSASVFTGRNSTPVAVATTSASLPNP